MVFTGREVFPGCRFIRFLNKFGNPVATASGQWFTPAYIAITRLGMCRMDAKGYQKPLVRKLQRLFYTGFKVRLICDQVIGGHDQ